MVWLRENLMLDTAHLWNSWRYALRACFQTCNTSWEYYYKCELPGPDIYQNLPLSQDKLHWIIAYKHDKRNFEHTVAYGRTLINEMYRRIIIVIVGFFARNDDGCYRARIVLQRFWKIFSGKSCSSHSWYPSILSHHTMMIVYGIHSEQINIEKHILEE